MGVVKNISAFEFPKQGSWLNKRVKVCFNYDTQITINGTIVREDDEEPGIMIIKLDNDNFVLSTECQYQLL